MQPFFTLRAYLLIFLSLFFANSIFSQTQKEPKFGKIKKEQLQKKADDKFPDAHAVVLFDYGDSYYTLNQSSGQLRINFERHVAIQFFDNTEFDQATFETYLYRSGSRKEKISKIKGVTYNLVDGKVEETKFSKKEIIEEEVDKYRSIKKITMPNVKEGSIIELSYEVTSDFPSSMKPWLFQKTIPTRYSEYNIGIPDFFIFNKNFVGSYAPNIKPIKRGSMSGYTETTQGWSMTDLPAFDKESYMRSFRNYICRIEFELQTFQIPGQLVQNFNKSWEDIRDDLMEDSDFGKQIKKNRTADKILDITGKEVSEASMIKIYEHIKNYMKWNRDEDIYSYDGIKKALDDGVGSSADINLLLIATLQEAGFNVKPTVLSTRSNGMLPLSSPSRRKLNYVIASVQLGGMMYHLDATEDYLPAGVLPVRCFNGNFVTMDLKNKNVKVESIKPFKKEKSATQNILTITEDGTLEGTVKQTKSGYAAIDFRKAMVRADSEEKYVEELQDYNEGLTIEDYKFENLENVYADIKEEYQVSIEEKAEMAGDLIYINPMIYDGMKANPFKLKERKYPVDFAIPIEETYMLKLTIPEGYVLESAPEDQAVALPEKAGQFTYSVKNIGGDIMVISRFKMNKLIFVESEYAGLKEFYNMIIKKHSEQLVLKKG